MHVPARGADGIGKHVHERRHVVLRDGLAFLHRRRSGPGARPDAARKLEGIQPGQSIPATFKGRPVVAKPFRSELLLQTLLAMTGKP